MDGLTREEAIERHRRMWSWISSETLRRGHPVSKQEARDHFNWPMLNHGCWLCEFNGDPCDYQSGEGSCIVQWPGGRCSYEHGRGGLFDQWVDAYFDDNGALAAELAMRIAMLPEKEEPDNAT